VPSSAAPPSATTGSVTRGLGIQGSIRRRVAARGCRFGACAGGHSVGEPQRLVPGLVETPSLGLPRGRSSRLPLPSAWLAPCQRRRGGRR
jgi:hypothetical protein